MSSTEVGTRKAFDDFLASTAPSSTPISLPRRSFQQLRSDKVYDHLGQTTSCALQGTPAWFDAIRLGDAAAELSKVFGKRGDARNEGAALDLRGRITAIDIHCSLEGSGNAAHGELRDRCNRLLGSHAGTLGG